MQNVDLVPIIGRIPSDGLNMTHDIQKLGNLRGVAIVRVVPLDLLYFGFVSSDPVSEFGDPKPELFEAADFDIGVLTVEIVGLRNRGYMRVGSGISRRVAWDRECC